MMRNIKWHGYWAAVSPGYKNVTPELLFTRDNRSQGEIPDFEQNPYDLF